MVFFFSHENYWKYILKFEKQAVHIIVLFVIFHLNNLTMGLHHSKNYKIK